MLIRTFFSAAALFSAVAIAVPAVADDRNWTPLRAEDRTQIEVFAYGDEIGRFEAVRVAVRGDFAVIKEVRLKFANGQGQRYAVNQRVEQGRPSAVIDLPRDRVRIVAAEIVYTGPGVPVLQGAVADDRDGFEVLDTVRLDSNDRRVSFKVDRGEEPVTTLRLRAWTGDVNIRRAEIVFGNGRSQEVRVRERLAPGDKIDIDLQGDQRRVREVNLLLRPQQGRAEPVRIDLLGKVGRYESNNRRDDVRDGPRRDRPGDWDLLGRQRAALFGKDSDVFVVGKNAGRFDSIRIRAVDQDVRMYGMTILYGNGEREDVPLYGTLRGGTVSQAFDLKGRDRFIQHVAFKYRAKLSLKGPAQVELWGRRQR